MTNEELNDMASVMHDGAQRICEEAIGKWMNPNYTRGLEDMVQERKAYWRRIHAGVPTKSAIFAFLKTWSAT